MVCAVVCAVQHAVQRHVLCAVLRRARCFSIECTAGIYEGVSAVRLTTALTRPAWPARAMERPSGACTSHRRTEWSAEPVSTQAPVDVAADTQVTSWPWPFIGARLSRRSRRRGPLPKAAPEVEADEGADATVQQRSAASHPPDAAPPVGRQQRKMASPSLSCASSCGGRYARFLARALGLRSLLSCAPALCSTATPGFCRRRKPGSCASGNHSALERR